MKICKTALFALGFLLLSLSLIGDVALAQTIPQSSKANDQFKLKTKPQQQTNQMDPLNRSKA